MTLSRFLVVLFTLFSFPAISFAEYQEAGGFLVFEAEKYHTSTVPGTHEWQGVCSIAGFTADGVVQALPEDFVNIPSADFATAPRLDFNVDVPAAATYFIWVLGYGVTSLTPASSNSFHMGVGGVVTAVDMNLVTEDTYLWTNGDPAIPTVMSLDLTMGANTINLWMRESGTIIDKIILTTSSTFDPTVDVIPVDSIDNGTTPFTTIRPVINPNGGSFTPGPQSVNLTSCTTGATIHWSETGIDPTTSDTTYVQGVTQPSLSADTTLKAFAVTAGMSDSAVSTAQFFLNATPVFTSDETALVVTNVDEDAAYSYSITTSDADNTGAELIITAPTLPAWLAFVDNADGTATLSNIPVNADVGVHVVSLVVTDLDGSTSIQNFNITVANTNDAPTITSTGVISGEQGTGYTYNITTADVDVGNVLTISASTKPVWLTLTDNGNGTATLTGTPGNDDLGNNNVTIDVTDDSGATNNSGSQSYTIAVANINDAPVFDSTAVTAATQGALYSYTIATSDIDVGDLLTITAPTLPTWLTLLDNGDGTATLSGTPTNDDVGANNVSLLVTDNGSGLLSTNQDFIITVANTNDAPTFTSTEITTGTQGVAYSYSITTTDIDSDNLIISATTLPAWLTLNDNGNGTAILTGIPLNGDVGVNDVVLLVTDDGAGALTGTQSFSIDVIEVNDAPSFASTAIIAAVEDSVYTYNIVILDADVGQAHTITANVGFSIPAWLSLTDNGNGTATLTGTPLNSDVGVNNIELLVTDNGSPANLTATQVFTITVVNTNDAPEFGSTATTLATEDTAFSYAITIVDLDLGDTLSIAANTGTTLPGWLILTDNGDGTASLTGMPTNDEVGNHDVELLVTDGSGVMATQIFIVTVTNSNDAPTVDVVVTDQSATEDDVFNLDISGNVSDVDVGDTLIFSVTGAPTSLSIDSATGIVSGTLTAADADGSPFVVSVTATDSVGATVTAIFTLTVAAKPVGGGGGAFNPLLLLSLIFVVLLRCRKV